MLYALAKGGKAPGFLAKVDKHGVPKNALYITTIVVRTAFFPR